MTLGRSRNRDESIFASAALAMALFERAGLTELIDSKFTLDKRVKLTPGNTVKAFIGKLLSTTGRAPIYTLRDYYLNAPTDLLFGEKVDYEAMCATSITRNLDLLFGLDLDKLSYECYQAFSGLFGFSSNMFNVDMTNFSVTSLNVDDEGNEAALPQRCGHAKDGHNERLVYSLLSVTDKNGIVCYERPYDGATADSEMDRGAIEFLSEKVDPKDSTLIADCKIVTAPLVTMMQDKGFGFISKCPENFGQKIKQDIVYSVYNGLMDPSVVRKGWEIYDTDAEVEVSKDRTMNLRFIAYRTADDIEAGIRYLREQGGKEAKARFGRFESKTFNCEVDARRAFEEALCEHTGSAYVPEYSIEEVQIPQKYEHRGRPRAGEERPVRTEYKVNVNLRFDEDLAKRLTQDRGIRVLITNLPRANTDADNVRFGATADTVLLSYLGQYRIEHAFRLLKSGFGMSCVYLHKASRANVMMFITSLATMIWDVITHISKVKRKKTTATKMVDGIQHLVLKLDRSSDYLYMDGPEREEDAFIEYLDTLDLDEDHLLK